MSAHSRTAPIKVCNHGLRHSWGRSMHRRGYSSNIPIDLIRTIVAVSETGSLTKAGDQLGLSQPAVSSQIKRIQALVGGPLFTLTANGSTPTPLGKLVVFQGRRILEANDQILRLSGAADGPQPIRVGLSTLLLSSVLKTETVQTLSGIVLHTDNSLGITKAFIDGYVDIAYMLENQNLTGEIEHLIVAERDEQYVWVRAKDFTVSPGTPIPLLTWPGDDIMIRTLTRFDLVYKVVFHSPDYHAKLAAVEAGIGLTAIPERLVPSTLVVANEDYLPPLPAIKSMLCVKPGLDTREATALIERLSTQFATAA